MKITHKQHLSGSSNGSLAHPDHKNVLDTIGGEPLQGSGFETETPEHDFEEEQ